MNFAPTCVRLLMTLACLLLFDVSGWADEAAYYCQSTTQTHVTITHRAGACAGFDWKPDQAAPPVHVDFGMPISGHVLVSDDGRGVVAIQSALYGGMKSDGSLFGYGNEAATARQDPVALLIYRDARLMASYRFSDILFRPRLVELSVSHVRWLRSVDDFDKTAGKKLILTTTSLREIRFDLESGKIESQQDSPEWTGCDVIAYGPVARLGTRGEMASPYLAKGDATEALSFSMPSRLERGGGGGFQSLCLKKDASGLHAVSTFPIIYNALTLEPRATPASRPAREVHFAIELEGISDKWELRIKPDIPLQKLEARVAGTEKWNYGTFTAPDASYLGGAAFVKFEQLPENALIEIQAIDGSGNKLGLHQKRFDTKAAVQRFFAGGLKRNPKTWLDISSMSNGNYVSFGDLVDARCALREIRYSIDNKLLDRRFPLPPCAFDDPSGGDYNRNISWPVLPKFVAVQIVFFDGTVSDIVIARGKK